MQGYVYFFKDEHSSLVKIGKTRNDYKKRKKEIQNMSPAWLYPIGVIGTPNCSKAEREMHEIFAPIRAHGEWFDFEGRIGTLKKCFKYKNAKEQKIFPSIQFREYWRKEMSKVETI